MAKTGFDWELSSLEYNRPSAGKSVRFRFIIVALIATMTTSPTHSPMRTPPKRNSQYHGISPSRRWLFSGTTIDVLAGSSVPPSPIPAFNLAAIQEEATPTTDTLMTFKPNGRGTIVTRNEYCSLASVFKAISEAPEAVRTWFNKFGKHQRNRDRLSALTRTGSKVCTTAINYAYDGGVPFALPTRLKRGIKLKPMDLTVA
ncbi:hypothetical protein BGZ47_002125 [Haplosporangium gracile]|nr:hypothetical protein BGZ47_002125 [Haplosporangium gracile]